MTRDELRELVRSLGYDPAHTYEIRFLPSAYEVSYYRTNEDGVHFLVPSPDGEERFIASATIRHRYEDDIEGLRHA